MEPPTNSLRKTLDAVPTKLKRTGVGATIEIVGYETDHPTIAGHPLNNEAELLQAVSYSHARLRREAASAGCLSPALAGGRRWLADAAMSSSNRHVR